MSFREVGVELGFSGADAGEVGVVKAVGEGGFPLPVGTPVVAVDPRYYRPTEVDLLLGDPTKARTKMGWEPRYDLAQMCAEMVRADIDLFRRDELLKKGGFTIRHQHE